MKYTDFTLDQLNSTDYKKISNMFFELAKTKEEKEILESILYEGGYKDFGFSTHIGNRDNPQIEMQRRISMANLFVQNPKSFDILQKNNINIFHGTNANALPSILKYGVNSYDESLEKGIYVTTGETSTRQQGRSFISFTDVLDVAEDYSTINSTKDDENLSFEVIIGTTKEEVKKIRTTIIRSDVPEIGINKNLPKESIKLLGVPSSKVNYVKKIVNQQIEVIAIDNIKNKFYYVDDMGTIYFDQNRYQQIKDQQKQEDKVFTLSELKELIRKRLFKKNQNEEEKTL